MDLITPTDCPYYLVSRVTLLMTSALKKSMAAAGVGRVRPSYLGVLWSLWREDGIPLVELGRRAGLEPSTMTGLIDRMERDGLVVRSANPNDRRAQHIHLSESGYDLREPVTSVVDRTLSNVLDGVSAEELTHTIGVLRQILENARRESGS